MTSRSNPNPCPFRGSLAALPTPFAPAAPFASDGLDLEALDRLVEHHAANGTSGLLVAGSTGEGLALSERELQALVERAVRASGGRLAVLAGVGTASTRSTIELARLAARAGADGLVVVAPYYVKPGPRGLFAHYAAVADAVDLPIVLYNNPGRTGSDLAPATVAAIAAEHENVVAIKESSGSLVRNRELVELGIALFAGDDHLIAESMALGARGAIGVVANVAPRAVSELVRAAAPGGDAARARELARELAALVGALALEPNPVPVKAALAALGLCEAGVRAPLVPLAPAHQRALEAALGLAGLAAL